MNWLPITSFFAEPGVTQAGGLFLTMLIPMVLGIALFGFGMSREKEGGGTGTKFLSIVPFFIAAVMGFPYFTYAIDPFNKKMNAIGGRSEQVYWISFWLPVLAIVGISVFFIIEKLRGPKDEQF